MKKILTKEQEKIIDINCIDDTKNVVIISVPGSGKTFIIEHKIRHEIKKGLYTGSFLVLTFGVLAAKELKDRLPEYNVEIRTIDSFFLRIIFYIDKNIKVDYTNITEILFELIKDNEDNYKFAEKYCSNYKYIFIDEFQDTSIQQYDILMKLFKYKKIIAVGDPCQSIYTWRNASEKIFEIFIDETDPYIFHMTYCFRSSKRICEFANDMLGLLYDNKKIVSFNDIEDKDSNIVIILEPPTMKLIEELKNEFKIYSLDDTFGYLFRNRQNIDKYSMMKVLPWLKTYDKESHEIEIIFLKIVEYLSGVFITFEELFINVLKRNKILITRLDKRVITLEFINEYINDFVIDKNSYRLIKIISDIHYQNLKFNENDLIRILDYLEELLGQSSQILGDIVRTSSSLDDILDKLLNAIYNNNSKSEIITITQSKGKEFDNVFIFMKRMLPSVYGMFNHYYIRDSDRMTREELRLLYVGITRARKNLFIFTSRIEFENTFANTNISAYEFFENKIRIC